MTKQDFYDAINDIIKVNPLATDADKLQGYRHRILLKMMVDYMFTVGGVIETGEFPFDWTTPSNAFGGYYNSETTFKDGMIKFLHRDTTPRVGLSASNARREYGTSQSTDLSYEVSPGSNPLTAFDINGHQFNPKGPLSGIYSVITPQDTDTTYTLTAHDAAGYSSAVNASVRWFNKMFVFKNSANLSNASVATLDSTINGSSGFLTDNRNSSTTLSTNREILYIAYPANFDGSPVTIKVNGIQDTSFTSRSFLHTNSFGHQETYKIYQGSNVLTGQYLLETY